MMRVSPATRDKVMKVAAEDYGGATADETLQRLLDEHWERQAVEAMDRFRAEDPEGWQDYLREADEWDAIPGPPLDPWEGNAA